MNQVRYNYANSIIASSGVEKVIKFWSTFPLPYGSGGLQTKTNQRDNRKVFSHEDYINLVLESGQFVTHDYSHQSVQEDPRMMAFFDSLVQRDIEGWTSDSSDSIDGESSFYELCWNAPYLTDDSHSNSNSSAHNSDNESVNGLNSHYFSYLDVITKRIESNDLIKEKNSKENDTEMASTSASTSVISSPSSVLRDKLLLHTDSNKDSGLNRISKLITEKKKEQLKKITKLTVRTTRKKLKRIQKRSSAKENGESTENSKKFDLVKKKLDYLAQQVNCDSGNNDDKPGRQPSRRNYRRLRFLTNQSDLVFNEVLPIVSSSSSSDSDDSNFVSGEELYQAISNEVQRMRHILSNDTDAENTSDDSSDSFELIDASVSAKHKLSSSSDEENEEKECKECTTSNSNTDSNKNKNNINTNTDNKEDKQKNSSKVSLLSNIVSHQYNDEIDSDSDEESNHIHEPVIHCPYKHNLCHASTSTSTTNEIKKSKIVFKPIDTRKRSYRKRKRSGSANNDKLNKDSDNNENKDHD